MQVLSGDFRYNSEDGLLMWNMYASFIFLDSFAYDIIFKWLLTLKSNTFLHVLVNSHHIKEFIGSKYSLSGPFP